MNSKIKIWLATLALAGVAISCNLPTRAQSPSDGVQEKSAPGASTEQAPIPQLDFSQVRLTPGDLPQGFEEISAAEINQLGFDVDAFLQAITSPLAKAEPQNLSALVNEDGVNSTIVVSFIIQPLTSLERGAFDLLARSPESAVNLFKDAASGLSFSAQTNLAPVGDSVIGATFSYEKATIPLDGELVISRRDQVVQVVMVAYMRGGSPAITAIDLATKMDDKIRVALE